MDKKFLPEYFYNRITYFGAALAALVLLIEGILFGMDLFSGNANVYLSLFIYIILPPFLAAGVLLVAVGALRRRRRIRLNLPEHREDRLVIDLSIPRHRNTAFVIFVVSVILLVLTAVGAYKAFHYTESVNFCGLLCHKVMKPEYTTYSGSSHARVKCVECHIGGGAGWYVRSKVSGLRQVIKTVQGTYPRPVPVPIHDLRPAKETCEECHWPGKLFGDVEQERVYFSGEDTTPSRWTVRMLMHVSGRGQENNGIHAHMYVNNKVSYVADDEKRQKISWVKAVDKKGVETIYTVKDSPYNKSLPPQDKVRPMDCMDCHSRPAHKFESPVRLINRAMLDGRINAGIPLIKAKAVDALAKKYVSEKAAVDAIRAGLLKYYAEKQAVYYAGHQQELRAAIEQVVLIYRHDFFPEMKARWDEYPDNIGHWISPGCFRCHDGEHRSSDGRVISRNCDTCHTIIAHGAPDNMQKNIDGLPFQHPFVDDDSWKTTNCSDCHSGT